MRSLRRLVIPSNGPGVSGRLGALAADKQHPAPKLVHKPASLVGIIVGNTDYPRFSRAEAARGKESCDMYKRERGIAELFLNNRYDDRWPTTQVGDALEAIPVGHAGEVGDFPPLHAVPEELELGDFVVGEGSPQLLDATGIVEERQIGNVGLGWMAQRREVSETLDSVEMLLLTFGQRFDSRPDSRLARHGGLLRS